MSNQIALSQGSVRQIVSVKGNVTGQRYILGGDKTAAELRADLKAKGLKGNKLSNAVREVMRGNQSIAWANAQVGLEACRKGELSPAVFDIRKNSAVLRFVSVKEAAAKVKASKAEKTVAEIEAEAEKIVADRIGCTIEELRARYNVRKA